MVDDFVVISWKFWMESFDSNFNHCRLHWTFDYIGNTVFLLFESRCYHQKLTGIMRTKVASVFMRARCE
jgi:hypothetical protein